MRAQKMHGGLIILIPAGTKAAGITGNQPGDSGIPLKTTAENDRNRDHHHLYCAPHLHLSGHSLICQIETFWERDGVLEIINKTLLTNNRYTLSCPWQSWCIVTLSLTSFLFLFFYVEGQFPQSSTSVPQTILSSIPTLWLFLGLWNTPLSPHPESAPSF